MKRAILRAFFLGIAMMAAALTPNSASARPPESGPTLRLAEIAPAATEFSARRKHRRRIHVVRVVREKRAVYLGRPILYRPFIERDGPQGDGLRRSCAGQPFGFGHRPRFSAAGSGGAEPWNPLFGCRPRFGLFPDLGL